MATEIEIGGNVYSIGKMNAMEQFHVSRRVAPILPSLAPLLTRLKHQDQTQVSSLDLMMATLQPLADGIAAMSDADSEYVINTCMAVVQRQQAGGWRRAWNDHGAPMFEDIDMAVMLQLAGRVIASNLAPFIAGLLTSQQSSPANSTAD